MSNTTEKPKKRQLTIQMDEDLYESFKRVATANDRKMGLLVRDFAKQYVLKNGQGELFPK
ncbi:hypothetical protein LP109_14695 (plasmid) [Moraxella bovis]|uniref:CopG family transcriptional regulator n=1 Tax=Moraxella bovis TaxID=476 RepID=A0ABY6MBC2_MORBO|nr:hypothetical protein [Moraxella bovis]UYZ77092.1 hypothetical protein LP093_14060 [Moraxella bovis]UYZ79782.1 hypothetical protein LP115_14060 [Moraxella bovis]UYZ88256.1 hypothetical protein LP094_14205 [Moraxella bovis]UYZ90998.1 hypothetical protein LP114_14325 [Moraxella bovis]UYZ99231.1 hypothetical protein LP107_14085 [Moraxella bovis]